MALAKKENDVHHYEAESPMIRAMRAAGYCIFILVLTVTTYHASTLFHELSATNFAPAAEYTNAAATE